ncbi:lysine--tRNA ligase [candidate division WWE3 bacterium RIFOXYC1_FULL_39_7]|uniref:Lysine--tRNA ligase n=2 Tax=Katanobacteria TaxID=422282 RepID=A0A1F4X7B3_UNCKA|nr:MAG: lysine--tRNA ligase [candidate division WWE3 bacterium RIFOXYC1_FULL_39_7]OGC77441.1 MAG: lysine--tRNA ligase [candidate division WWE3 bacterium RIFOXYD1_FULL_39_9]
MATLAELRNIRLEKLNKLRELGIDPYPARSYVNQPAVQVRESFDKLEGKEATVAGRITAMRLHRNLAFIDLKDSTGKIQLYIKEDTLQEPDYKKSEIGYGDLGLLDIGDFAEGTGIVTKTKTGEVSIQVANIRVLAKTLRPLPDQWDGLKDKETRLRRRYLDTNINEDVYQRFIRRAKFWEVHREFFKEHKFYEINIPVLEMIPGGADSKPFITHMDAIDQDFYLRISQELYLKRLIGGGYERVCEIGPRFRNEGLSDEHLPEHIAMEFYWAYADWKKGMEFVKQLYDRILDEVYDGKKVFNIRGMTVDFSKGWEEIDFAEVMNKKYGIDVHKTTAKEVGELIKKHHVKGDFDKNVTRGIDMLWKEVRKEIAGPAFLINHPKYISPLAKAHFDAPHITERFQPIIAGSELGNGWSEINDPLDQLARFREQQQLRDEGDDEAQWLDIDYVEMLEYGMPPTFGFGHSERVFWFLEDVSAREGVPFPQLKFEIDESTKSIYGL